MNLSLILFLIGILGFVLNRKNIILMLISIEIMLLAITFLILVSSLSFDDILGQTYAIYIIAIAGAESAIGLGILVAFYRLNNSYILSCLSHGPTTYSKKINKFSSKIISRSYSTITNSNSSIHPSISFIINP
jgi:NADH-ubiquinone oxidoreductase chain 4L